MNDNHNQNDNVNNNDNKDDDDNNDDDDYYNDLINSDNVDNDKQMLGGCCVCSDDIGYADNELVYCDGKRCQVAVHQGCYGIITIPEGNWFCRRCEQKNILKIQYLHGVITKKEFKNECNKIHCQFCPLKEGAIKLADNSKWAHVICALYIPETYFANVRTMENIITKHLRSDRLNKKCSICENSPDFSNRMLKGLPTQNKSNNQFKSIGAYVNCANKSGCKRWFHVTCAQISGLLCEDQSSNNNSSSNIRVTYCVYCENHFSKLDKSAMIKPQHPFRLVLPQNDSKQTSNAKNGTSSTSTTTTITTTPSNNINKNKRKYDNQIEDDNKNKTPTNKKVLKISSSLP
jgi:protein AF-17/10